MTFFIRREFVCLSNVENEIWIFLLLTYVNKNVILQISNSHRVKQKVSEKDVTST